MDFPYGTTVYRLRAPEVPSPYNPEATVPGDWANATAVAIPGAFVAQSSTTLMANESREQALEAKSLFCEGSVDIRKGDRIRVGGPDGPLYTIDGIPPAADTNPFTGWTPPREIPLTRYMG